MKKNITAAAAAKKGKKKPLLRVFLRGSRAMFALSIVSAAVSALADMINPQIIRAAVDNAIGGKEASFPAPVMNAVFLSTVITSQKNS